MKIGRLFVTGGSICLLLTLFFGCGEQIGEKEYTKALSAIKANDPVNAQLHLEKAIKRLNGNRKAEANHQLGLIYWKLQKTGEAIKAFKAASSLSEEGVTESNLNLAAAYFQSGDWNQAELEVNKVLNINPTHTGALALRSLILMQQNQWTAASTALSQGLQTTADTAAGQNLLAIAQDLQIHSNIDAALSRLRNVIATDPTFAPALFNLASIYDHGKANSAEAAIWYGKYLDTQPGDTAIANEARKALERLNAGTGSTMTGHTPQPRTDPILSQRFFAEGARLVADRKYREALEAYRKAIEADPTNRDPIYNTGITYYSNLKEYESAIKYFKQCIDLQPDDTDARYMQALSLHMLKRPKEAKQKVQELLRINPDHQQGKALLKILQNLR